MRNVSLVRRAAAILAVIALLLVPVVGFADDSEIRPPQPQSVLQPAQPSVWHALFVVLAKCGILPLVS